MAIRNDAGLTLNVCFLRFLFFIFGGGKGEIFSGDREARRSRASFPSGLILSDRS